MIYKGDILRWAVLGAISKISQITHGSPPPPLDNTRISSTTTRQHTDLLHSTTDLPPNFLLESIGSIGSSGIFRIVDDRRSPVNRGSKWELICEKLEIAPSLFCIYILSVKPHRSSPWAFFSIYRQGRSLKWINTKYRRFLSEENENRANVFNSELKYHKCTKYLFAIIFSLETLTRESCMIKDGAFSEKKLFWGFF